MTIKLKKQNEETFKNVCSLFKKNNRVAVEQATGTGKSYITAKVIDSISKKKTLYITSGRVIIREFKNSLDLNSIVDIDYIDFLTYQGALTFDVNNLKDKYEMEFGHCKVSSRYHDTKLSNWVRTQRKTFKNGKISKSRYNRLVEIGFIF